MACWPLVFGLGALTNAVSLFVLLQKRVRWWVVGGPIVAIAQPERNETVETMATVVGPRLCAIGLACLDIVNV